MLSQWAVQWALSPASRSRVQGSPSSGQVTGQVAGGSQVSPAASRPSPQVTAQSVSPSASQPAGQQPSPETQAVIARWLHAREHPLGVPVAPSVVQAS